MKTRLTLLTCLMLVCLWRVQAAEPAEQLFLNENFQGWAAASAKASETTIKAVTYYGDSIKYTLYNVAVMPTYTAKNTNGVTTVGAIQTQKVDPASSYFIVSGFPNVTKATFTHSYTGGTRGCIISCKGDGDADWAVLLNANTTAASGQSNTFDINKTNVSLRFQGNMALTSCTEASVRCTNTGIWPRISKSVCIFTPPLCSRNVAQGQRVKHKLMVVLSKA